jgi:hypothetical protein
VWQAAVAKKGQAAVTVDAMVADALTERHKPRLPYRDGRHWSILP